MFERLTDDHSLVEELVRQGKLTPRGGRRAPAALDHHARARARGGGRGRHAHLAGARRRRLPALQRRADVDDLRGARSPSSCAGAASLPDAGRTLIDAANAAGGRDNITVVLFRLEDVGALGGGGSSQDTTEHDAVTAPGRTEVGGAAATEPATAAGAAAAGPATAVAAPPRRAVRPPPRAARPAPAPRGRPAPASRAGRPRPRLLPGRRDPPRRVLRVADGLLRRHRATTAS